MYFKLNNVSFSYRLARESDVSFFFKLQRSILSITPKSFFLPFTKKEFLTNITGDSRIWLIYFKKELIGFSGVFCPLKLNEKYCANFKLVQDNTNKVGEFCGTMISPEYRHLGLQNYFIKLREDYLKRKSYHYSIVTVDVNNKNSLNNLKKHKYKTIVIKDYFKKSIREYMRKKLL